MLLLLGLLLAVVALPVSREKEAETPQLLGGSQEEETNARKTELETKLETILESVEGVGKVRVLLMTGEDKDVQGLYASGSEKVTGVLVSAEGADNSVSVQNIQQAIMALFQIEAHKIKIMKMK